MGIDHRGTDILVPKQFLHSSNIIAILQQVGREGMAEPVATGGLGSLSGSAHIFNSSSEQVRRGGEHGAIGVRQAHPTPSAAEGCGRRAGARSERRSSESGVRGLYANFAGGAGCTPRLGREGKPELTEAPRLPCNRG